MEIESQVLDEKEGLIRQVMLSNVASTSLELAGAVLSNSLSLYADSLKEFVELMTNLASWLIFRQVRKYSHRFEFGFGKVETLLGVMAAGGLLFGGYNLIRDALERLVSPRPLEKVGFGLVLNIAWIGVEGYNWYKLRRSNREHPSPAMAAMSSACFASSLFCAALAATLAVGKLLGNHPWALYVDPVVSLGFSTYLIWTGIKILRGAFGDLTDQTLDESLQLVITRELAAHFEKYEQWHGLRSRRNGGMVEIELELEFDPKKNMAQVYEDMEKIRTSLHASIRHSRVTIIPVSRQAQP